MKGNMSEDPLGIRSERGDHCFLNSSSKKNLLDFRVIGDFSIYDLRDF